MTHPSEAQPTSPLAGFLSFLVPGLGQIYQGRVAKGLLFFVCLMSLFHLGAAMGNWQNVYIPTEIPGNFAQNRTRPTLKDGLLNRWHYPGQFWIGIAAWPALWQFYEMPLPSAEKFPFWNRYQRAPREDDRETEKNNVNRFLVNSDKTPDMGLMYTVIAGVLNILVIYDAFAGPAFPPSKKRKPAVAVDGPTQEIAS